MALYRDFHANPELSMQETRSAARMADEARRAGFTVTTGRRRHRRGRGAWRTGPARCCCCAPTWTRCRSRSGPACLSPAARAARPARGSTPVSCTPAATTPTWPPGSARPGGWRRCALQWSGTLVMVGAARRGDEPGRQGDARGRPVHPLPQADPRHRLPRFGDPAGRNRSAIRTGRRSPTSTAST